MRNPYTNHSPPLALDWRESFKNTSIALDQGTPLDVSTRKGYTAVLSHHRTHAEHAFHSHAADRIVTVVSNHGRCNRCLHLASQGAEGAIGRGIFLEHERKTPLLPHHRNRPPSWFSNRFCEGYGKALRTRRRTWRRLSRLHPLLARSGVSRPPQRIRRRLRSIRLGAASQRGAMRRRVRQMLGTKLSSRSQLPLSFHSRR